MPRQWSGYVTTFVIAANILVTIPVRLSNLIIYKPNYSPLNLYCDIMPVSAQAPRSAGESNRRLRTRRAHDCAPPSGIRSQQAACRHERRHDDTEERKVPAPGDANPEAKLLRLKSTESDRRRPRHLDVADQFSAAHSARPGLARQRPDQRQRACHQDAASVRR